jgi:uncharacterized membrane protein YjjP (DUF1212 family)
VARVQAARGTQGTPAPNPNAPAFPHAPRSLNDLPLTLPSQRGAAHIASLGAPPSLPVTSNTPPLPAPPSPFEERTGFIVDLARRLHLAGVSAARLEGAVRSTAAALGVQCEIWATPTGLLLSLGDATSMSATQQTRVLRLEPANVDLAALVALDGIADRVIAGQTTVADGFAEFRELDRPPPRSARLVKTLAFGLAAAAVAGLFGTGWLEIIVSAFLGVVIGTIVVAGSTRPHLGAASEAVAALIATVLATAFAHFVAPIAVQSVVVASLIVLMPGLTLTTAISELAAQQLVTGTTRFAGALVTLLKLTFGSVAGAQLAAALGWTVPPLAVTELPGVVEIVAMVAAAASFAVLFRAPRGDVPLVMGSAVLGYVLTRAGDAWLGLGSGTAFAGSVFFSSLAIAALANAYGRVRGRPGALVRVPGIMLLVPGSVGFRGLAFVMERDYALGMDTAVAVLSALAALTAGLLFGSLVVPPRRYL